jgi:hypothetical protein
VGVRNPGWQLGTTLWLTITRRSFGLGAVTLMRFGPFEIRVFQPSSAPPTNAIIFWIELFDHDRQLSIDSIGDCTLDDAVIAAEDFIARATTLNENPNAWRRPT